jgi:mevalonate kinase
LPAATEGESGGAEAQARGRMDQLNDLVAQLLAALEERGAPDAVALADLLRLEQHLADSLGIVRRLVDAIVRREGSTL